MRILQEREFIDRWFLIRYNDPEPHLSLRFHASEGVDPMAILALALPWCQQYARLGQIQRYTLDTYEREVERYGGPEAIDLLEHVFTLDSVIVSDMLAFLRARRLTLDPLALAVYTLDHLFAARGCTFEQRLEWTRTMSEKYAWSKEFRPERKRYCALLSPRGQLDAVFAEQRALRSELVCAHDDRLGTLGKQVRQPGAADKLWGAETSPLTSLAHMHSNRLLGLDRSGEQQACAFWRHTLDSLERRPGER